MPHSVLEDLARGTTSAGTSATEPATDPSDAPPHLLLGITAWGFMEFCMRIGFPFEYRNPNLNGGNVIASFDGKEWLDCRGGSLRKHWLVTVLATIRDKYPLSSSYRRDAQLAWVTATHGERPVGYDLCAAIRAWLEAHGHEGRSVCEVLREEGSHHVGPAEAFLSHCQGEDVGTTLLTTSRISLFNSTMQGTVRRRLSTQPLIWIDYFVLRQCSNDFVPEQIVSTIRTIGLTVMELDLAHRYVERCFCILEAYATVKTESELVCLPTGVVKEAMCPCDGVLYPQLNVDTRAAKTRRPEDKVLIDAYIERNVGFHELDAIIRYHVLHGWRLMTFGIWVPLISDVAADHCPRAALCGCATASWLTCGLSFDLCTCFKHKVCIGFWVLNLLRCLCHFVSRLVRMGCERFRTAQTGKSGSDDCSTSSIGASEGNERSEKV